jgi:TM2 domain-containing membrane protein YozV
MGMQPMQPLKNSGVGIVLSFFWTGLGQLYAGSIGRGLIMMVITPVLWLFAWFGAFSTLVGGAGSLVAPTGQQAAAGAGLGILGFILLLAPVVFWVWGMYDAKQLCEAFNRSATSGGASPGRI